jgi:cell division protein ZipA
MDALRVSLLIIGVVVVAGIYYFSFRKLDTNSKRSRLFPEVSAQKIFSRVGAALGALKQKFHDQIRKDPTAAAPVTEQLNDTDIDSLNHIVTNRHVDDVEIDDVSVIVELTTEQIAPAGEQLFIPITIVAPPGKPFSGEAIMRVADELGIKLGDDGVFRYATNDAMGYEQALLGLANIMEPGTFAADHLTTFETPGLVLYLHLPGPIEPRDAFDTLVEVGQALAEKLGGELCDETRSVLTRQTIGHLKEKVEAYRFKQKMTHIKQRRPR